MDPPENAAHIPFEEYITSIPALQELKNFNAPQLYAKLNSSDDEFMKFMQDLKLIPRSKRCECGNSMVPKYKSNRNVPTWRCHKSSCKKEKGFLSGTWFEGCHLSLKQIFQLSYFWCRQTHTVEEAQFDLQKEEGGTVSNHIITDYNNIFRQVCTWYYTRNPIKIGGPGTVVEIDETVLTKRKYNRGQLRADTQWFFGGVERGTKKVFLVPVERRNADTLLPLIAEHILPETTIISDCWAAYGGIERMQKEYSHYTVNHSQNFVDPATGAHTNTIEGTWANFKCRHKEEHGTRRELFGSYISQFVWRQEFKGPDTMFHLWGQVAYLYPVD